MTKDMMTYTTLRNMYGTMTLDTGTDNMTLGDSLINDSVRAVLSLRPFAFLERTETVDTVASQQGYEIPNSLRETLADVYVTVGDTVYMPSPVSSEEEWKLILSANLGESDNQSYWYREGDKVLFAPTPATSSNTITFRGRRRVPDIGIADYTTGTVVSVAHDGVAVVGSGTSWTASMAGRHIRITASDTANNGDGQWYEILSVTDSTHLTLLKPYLGTAIAAGAAAYTIGQTVPIPEEYDIAPVYRAVALYHSIHGDSRAERFWRMYDGGKEAGLSQSYGGVIGRLLNSAMRDERRFVPPDELEPRDPNCPPDVLTGF